MTTVVSSKLTQIRWPAAAWLPLAILPLAAGVLTAGTLPWVQMWALAISMYASFNWLTFATSPAARHAGVAMSACYLLLWTGMDAEAFFSNCGRVEQPRWTQWSWAVAQAAFGIWVLLGVALGCVESHPVFAGWVGMAALVSILHFGVSQLLSLAWRSAGVNAQHIMHKPVFARSLADFWGRRWNLAFRDLAHRFVFQFFASDFGSAWATMAVFAASGIIHDIVISYTARGSWGSPTLYFLIQGAGLLAERSRLGTRLGLGRGIVGRLFAAAVVFGPVGMLFHAPFMTRVVAPMVQTISETIR